MLSQAPQEILICVWDCDTAPSGRVPLRLAGLADNLTTAIARASDHGQGHLGPMWRDQETILGCVEPCVDAVCFLLPLCSGDQCRRCVGRQQQLGRPWSLCPCKKDDEEEDDDEEGRIHMAFLVCSEWRVFTFQGSRWCALCTARMLMTITT